MSVSDDVMKEVGNILAERQKLHNVRSNSQPSHSDLDLVSQVKQLFYNARAAKRTRVARWNRNYRILYNRTWKAHRPDWLPSPEVPEIYPIISSVVGWMTDQRPDFSVIPSAEQGTPFYDFFSTLSHDLEVCLDTAWTVHNWEKEIEQVIWDGNTYGLGVFKSCWDQTLVSGMGDANLLRVDPYTIYLDPAATSKYDLNYIIEARNMSLQEIDRRWPGAADLLTDGGYIESIDIAPTYDDNGTSTPMASLAPTSPSTSPTWGMEGQGRSIKGQLLDHPGVTVFECWLREHEYDDDSYEGETFVKDEWRCVVVAGNHVLMDENAKDLFSHGQHPYEFYTPHQTGELYGLSMVDMLAPSQLSLNRLLATIEHNLLLSGNPVLLEDARAQISRTKIVNRPGQRLTKQSGGEVEWLTPPQINPQFFQMVEFYIGEMERISGLSAITRGMAPGGRNAASVIDSMQEASFVRVRMALRNLEWALRNIGEKLASNICEFYTEPRIIGIVGPSAKKSSLALRNNHFYVPTEKGQLPLRFQLLVQAGSALSTSPTARKQDYLQLFALGAIDIEELLAAFNIPNRREVADRVKAERAMGIQPPGARQRSMRQQ